MKNLDKWQESKFQQSRKGQWQASRENIPVTSWLVVDRIAASYSKVLTKYATGDVVDLGCGRVPQYGMYRELVDSVTCIDWPNSLHGAEFVDRFADLNEVIDLGLETFDTVFALDVIEHLHTPLALFLAAAKALKPGGHLIVGAPFMYLLHEDPHDYHRYTRYALEKMTQDARLSVAEIHSWGGAPDVLCDIFVKSMSRSRGIDRLLYASTRPILSLWLFRRINQATAERFPLGYTLVARKSM